MSYSKSETLEFLERLKGAILVKIEKSHHADAFVLFETINNRGIPLSAIDIIKNNLLAALDRFPNYGIDRAFDEWTDLVELLPDTGIQEQFLVNFTMHQISRSETVDRSMGADDGSVTS